MASKGEDDFLWLVSLSDLMILLFVFFVVLFSFSAKNMTREDVRRMAAVLKNEKIPTTPIDEVQKKIDSMIQEKNISEAITVEKKDDVLVMQIKENILFDSGEYSLRTAGLETIRTIGTILESVPPPYRMGIEGHTDDIPIHNAKATDNWELSAKRAHSILLALDLKPDTLKRAVVMGYAQMVPLVPNRTPAGQPIPENQQKNRRVTIRIF